MAAPPGTALVVSGSHVSIAADAPLQVRAAQVEAGTAEERYSQ